MHLQQSRTRLLLLGLAVILTITCSRNESSESFDQENTTENVKADNPNIPDFIFDESWPKSLPNNWALGDVWGVAVDSQDNPWIAHSNSERIAALLEEEGKELAPPVIQFDPDGNMLQAWGGPGKGYDWMVDTFAAEHGLFIDHEDNVWVIGGGTRADGGVTLKFTADGTFLLQIGENGKTNGSNDETLLGGPTTAAMHPTTNEIFIADGYTNQRVIVFDATTGDYKRHWGAYGRTPDDGPVEPLTPEGPPPQRWDPTHCVRVAHDGTVYVCDRGHNRVQIFETDGTFLDEVFIERATPAPWQFDLENNRYLVRTESGPGVGSASMVAFSHDAMQQYLYVGSATSYRKIYIVDRQTLELLGSIDTRGGNHEMSVDSKGNIYSVDGYSRWPERYLIQ